jgi:protein TonB
MKRLVFFLFYLLSLQSFAQKQNGPPVVGEMRNGIYVLVEEMPKASFDLNEYLSKSLEYPVGPRDAGVQGRVITKFIVNEDGTFDSLQVIKSPDPLLSKEALRVINAMPKWIPGRYNGKAVKVYYVMPIKFTLQR